MTIGELIDIVDKRIESHKKTLRLIMTIDKDSIDLIVPLTVAGTFINDGKLVETIAETERAGLADVCVEFRTKRLFYAIRGYTADRDSELVKHVQIDGEPVVAYEQAY